MSDMLNYYYGQGKLYGAVCDAQGQPLDWRWMGDVSNLELAITVDSRLRKISQGGILSVTDIHTVSQRVVLDATFHTHSPENVALLVYGQRWTYDSATGKETLRGDIQAGERVSLSHQTVWDVEIEGLNKDTDYLVDPLWGAITFLVTPGFAPVVTYFHTSGYHIPLLTTLPTTLALRYEGLNLAEHYTYTLLDLYRACFNPADLLSLINNGNSLSELSTTANILLDVNRQVDPLFGGFGRLTYPRAFGARITLSLGSMGYFDTVAPLYGRIGANLLSVNVGGLDVTLIATKSSGLIIEHHIRTDANGDYQLPVTLTPGSWTVVATATVIAPDGSIIPVVSDTLNVEINVVGTRIKMKMYKPDDYLFYVKDVAEVFTIDYGDGVDSYDYRIDNGYVYSTRPLISGMTYELTLGDCHSCVFGLNVAGTEIAFPNKVIEVISVKGLRKNLNGIFRCCDELTVVRPGAFSHLMAATDFAMAFLRCSKLQAIPVGLFDHTPLVTTFYSTFAECLALTTIPAKLFDNTPKVVTFASSFQGCINIIAIPTDLFKYTPLVSSMAQTFYKCNSIAAIPRGLLDPLTQLTSLDNTFAYVQKVISLPVGLLDKNTKLLSLNNTFSANSSLLSLPVGLFDTLSELRTLDGTFASCTKLTQIPSGLLSKNTGLVSANSFLNACSSLKAIPDGFLDNNTKLTNIGNMFGGCSSLPAIPAGLFDSTTLVNVVTQLFSSCRSIRAIPSGLFDHMPLITSLYSAFGNCYALDSIPTGLFDKTNKVISIMSLFNNCSTLTTIPAGLLDNMPLVSDASYAFGGCLALQSIPTGLFAKLPRVTSFSGVFYSCHHLKSIPDGVFDNNIQATNFTHAFSYCREVTHAPTGLLNNTQATLLGALGSAVPQQGYNAIFSNCTALESSLDNLFNAASYPRLKEVQGLFFENPKLTGSGLAFIAKVGQITDVKKYQGAFFGCTSLSDYNQLPVQWRTR